MTAPAAFQDDPRRSPLRWVLLIVFAVLLGIMLAAGLAALNGLRKMYAEQQNVRHAFADRARGISSLCLSIEVYNHTALDGDFSDGTRASLERLSAEISGDVNRLAADNHSEETLLLASIRELVARQQALYEDRRRRRAILTTQDAEPLEAMLLQWSRSAGSWSAERVRNDDEALLVEFGHLDGSLSQAFIIALASALVLVVASMIYILRLERQTQVRYLELARSRHELQRLSSRLVDAQESERRSISRELHDEIGQSLGALLVDLSRLSASLPPERGEVKEQVDRMKSVAEGSVQAVRNIALLLRPSMLDDLGLGPALEWQGREVSRRSDIEVEVHAENVPANLPSEYATTIYRLVQEALNNAVRHSGAKAAKVEVETAGRGIRVRISDDGRGFDPKRTRGLGILGMEERVKRLNGGDHGGFGSWAWHGDHRRTAAAAARKRRRMSRKTRVLLADDHVLIRAGLRMVVDAQTDLTVVGEAGDGREAVAMAESLKPDVVVMDIGMPGLNGIEAAHQIREKLPDSQIVMLSMHSDEGYVLRALKAGAKAYLLKDSAEADLVRAIRAAAEGKSFFSPAVGRVLLEDYVRKLQRTGGEDSYDLLSPREREILQLVAEGKSSKEIATLLNLSVYTVETHRARVMQKLNLRGIPELILYAVRKGIIS